MKTHLLKGKRYICFVILIVLYINIITFPQTATEYTTNHLLEQNTDSIPLNPKIQNIINMINESTLRKHLEIVISHSPRVTGTYGCRKTASYIYQELISYGLETRYHDWTAYGNRYHPGRYTSQNIEGKKTGIRR
ncbi:MAG: hypothetical protein QXS02_03790 [Candidatus Thermoplasmatota archaeon]